MARRRLALTLHREGLSPREIARFAGYASAKSVRRAVAIGLREEAAGITVPGQDEEPGPLDRAAMARAVDLLEGVSDVAGSRAWPELDDLLRVLAAAVVRG